MEFEPNDDSGNNLAEYTISEISGSIKRTVESAFGLVRIRGEISGFRGRHSSGHAYFSMKDDRARIEAVIWRGVFSKLKFQPEEGMEMIATGKVTTYPGSSKYQIVIEALEPAGAGALMAMLEERRKKLAAEGLFDAARKQLLPDLPRVIGVITSPTGAVIRDILHRINDRYPLHVIVWPVRVQGETTGEEVARAISGFNQFDSRSGIARPDVLIVARGGGSLEDLWGFNDEVVVRAAAESDIPVISAVGHETDWTLIDHAADQRAPTPTAAAEFAVPVKADLEAQVANVAARLKAGMSRLLDQHRTKVQTTSRLIPSADMILSLPRRRLDEASGSLGQGLRLNVVQKRAAFARSSSRLTPVSLRASLREKHQNIAQLAAGSDRYIERHLHHQSALMNRLTSMLTPQTQRMLQRARTDRETIGSIGRRADRAMEQTLRKASDVMHAQWRLLRSLSHKSVLERGFAVVRDEKGAHIARAANLKTGQPVSIEFYDGNITSITGGADAVPQSSESGKSAPRAKSRPKKTNPADNQGDLF